jgi:hypothetical protein
MIFRASICVLVVIEALMEGVGNGGGGGRFESAKRCKSCAAPTLVGMVPPVKLLDICWLEVFELDSALTGLEPNMV